jgi:hypothetical protein
VLGVIDAAIWGKAAVVPIEAERRETTVEKGSGVWAVKRVREKVVLVMLETG